MLSESKMDNAEFRKKTTFIIKMLHSWTGQGWLLFANATSCLLKASGSIGASRLWKYKPYEQFHGLGPGSSNKSLNSRNRGSCYKMLEAVQSRGLNHIFESEQDDS